MKRSIILAAALLLTASAAAAQAPQSGDSGGGVTRTKKALTGEEVYGTVCAACHMADAKGGTGAATIPALASNPRLGAAAYPVVIVTRGKGAMPSFRGMLDDAQIAAAITYVRTHFGNSYAAPVTEADVARMSPGG